MASSTQTVITIPKADFTTSGGTVNDPIFLQELKDASISADPEDVKQVASNVVVTFAALLVSADITAIDAAAAAHAGSAFSDPIQRQENNDETSSPDDTEVQCVQLTSGPLPAGRYDLEWYGEHKTDDASSSSKIVLRVSRSGGSNSVRASDFASQLDWDSWSGKLPFDNIADGETLDAEILIRRTASGSGNAMAQRTRIFLERKSG